MNKKKTTIITVMLVVLSIMAIGYSYFATRLNINATGSIDSSWNVYFSKIEVGDKSTGASTKSTPSVSNTTANMDVSLKAPGDYINFNITLVNGGSVDAIIEDIEATAEGTPAIIFSISGIKIGDKLVGGNSTSKVITIKMEYDTSVTSQPSELTKKLTVNIDAVQDIGQSITVTEPQIATHFARKILSSNEVKSDANIDFAKSSTEDGTSGLYYTSDLTRTENAQVSYYFRGPVENNYVVIEGVEGQVLVGTEEGEVCDYMYDYITVNGTTASGVGFGSLEECKQAVSQEDEPDPEMGGTKEEMCVEFNCETGTVNVYEEQPLKWRIVRINEDGSVRLVLASPAYENAKYAESSFDNGYPEDGRYSTSYANGYLKSWYNQKLKNYSSLLTNTGFCQDYSEGEKVDDGMDGYTQYYGAYDRLVNTKKPQFLCPSEDDIYEFSIGIITVDELVYAGLAYNTTSNYYLKDFNNYWALSPYSYWIVSGVGNEEMFIVDENSKLSSSMFSDMDDGRNLYPVINVRADVLASGTGTATNPYVIQTN